jgi:hypothetical protein
MLHDGPVEGPGIHDARGVVELSCGPTPSVVWRIEDRSVVGVPGGPATFVLRRPDGDAPSGARPARTELG